MEEMTKDPKRALCEDVADVVGIQDGSNGTMRLRQDAETSPPRKVGRVDAAGTTEVASSVMDGKHTDDTDLDDGTTMAAEIATTKEISRRDPQEEAEDEFFDPFDLDTFDLEAAQRHE